MAGLQHACRHGVLASCHIHVPIIRTPSPGLLILTLSHGDAFAKCLFMSLVPKFFFFFAGADDHEGSTPGKLPAKCPCPSVTNNFRL